MKQFCVIFTEKELAELFKRFPGDSAAPIETDIFNALASAQQTIDRED